MDEGNCTLPEKAVLQLALRLVSAIKTTLLSDLLLFPYPCHSLWNFFYICACMWFVVGCTWIHPREGICPCRHPCRKYLHQHWQSNRGQWACPLWTEHVCSIYYSRTKMCVCYRCSCQALVMHLDFARVESMWSTDRVAALHTRATSPLSAWILTRGLVSINWSLHHLHFPCKKASLICICMGVLQVRLVVVTCSLWVTVCCIGWQAHYPGVISLKQALLLRQRRRGQ